MDEADREQTLNTVSESAKREDGAKPAKREDGAKPAKREDGVKTAKREDGVKSAKRKGGGAGGRKHKEGGAAAGKKPHKHKKAARGRRKQKLTTQTITKSFGHAFDGILSGVEERNMKIHFTMAALVVFFGLILHISVTEWCICLVLFGLIMGLELVNTSLEALCDLVTKEYHPLAKRAKDTAAGAVLIASIMAAATGLIIFIPRLLYVLRSLF